MRSLLFHLPENKNKELFSHLEELLHESDIELNSIIKLRWLEYLQKNQLKLFIDDENINLVDKLTMALKKTLKNEWDLSVLLEDYVGILYKISEIENEKHFNFIINEVKENLHIFMHGLDPIIKEPHEYLDKRIVNYAKMILEIGEE